MIWKGWIYTIGLLAVALFWGGCETAGNLPPVNCIDDEARIGDTLLISVLNVPDAYQMHDKVFLVSSDGKINMPQIGSVPVAGKKFATVERELQTNYISSGFFTRCTVQVKPGDRFYTVGGEVKGGARIIYSGPTTVLRAIASCGDFTEFAKRTKVEINRASGQHEIVDCVKARRDSRYDRPICPGDFIYVPKSL